MLKSVVVALTVCLGLQSLSAVRIQITSEEHPAIKNKQISLVRVTDPHFIVESMGDNDRGAFLECYDHCTREAKESMPDRQALESYFNKSMRQRFEMTPYHCLKIVKAKTIPMDGTPFVIKNQAEIVGFVGVGMLPTYGYRDSQHKGIVSKFKDLGVLSSDRSPLKGKGLAYVLPIFPSTMEGELQGKALNAVCLLIEQISKIFPLHSSWHFPGLKVLERPCPKFMNPDGIQPLHLVALIHPNDTLSRVFQAAGFTIDAHSDFDHLVVNGSRVMAHKKIVSDYNFDNRADETPASDQKLMNGAGSSSDGVSYDNENRSSGEYNDVDDVRAAGPLNASAADTPLSSQDSTGVAFTVVSAPPALRDRLDVMELINPFREDFRRIQSCPTFVGDVSSGDVSKAPDEQSHEDRLSQGLSDTQDKLIALLEDGDEE